MAHEFTTAGVTLGYAVEATAGTRPTTGYTAIPNIKSTPDFNSAPSMKQVTDLSDTVYHRYVAGLRDLGGSVAFKANFTTAFQTAWETLCTASATASATSKATWFEIKIPGQESFYFAGIPQSLGLGALEVDSIVEIDAYIAPNQVAGFDTAST